MMAKTRNSPSQQIVDRMRDDFQHLLDDVRKIELNPRSRLLLSTEIKRSSSALGGLLAELDPIKQPSAVFDPGNPRTVGFFIGLAMAAQPRKPLKDLMSFYGAGVYAIYYTGAFEAYRPISSSESPIYVGKAIHGANEAPLAARLTEHMKNIQRAGESLDVADFECRSLVVQSGWEGTAEDYLIRMFRPLWNKEIKVLYGFGKHGDSSTTRKNSRSPWDTLHSGRKWAVGDQKDAKSLEQIAQLIEAHFRKTVIYKTFEDVFAAFLVGLKQSE